MSLRKTAKTPEFSQDYDFDPPKFVYPRNHEDITISEQKIAFFKGQEFRYDLTEPPCYQEKAIGYRFGQKVRVLNLLLDKSEQIKIGTVVGIPDPNTHNILEEYNCRHPNRNKVITVEIVWYYDSENPRSGWRTLRLNVETKRVEGLYGKPDDSFNSQRIRLLD